MTDNVEEPEKSTNELMSWGALQFIEAPSSRVLSIAIFTLIFSTVLTFIVSLIVKIDVSVKAEGHIETIDGVKEAVTSISGHILSVGIKDGDIIKKGSVIATLKIEGATEKQLKNIVTLLRMNLDYVKKNKKIAISAEREFALVSNPPVKAHLIEIDKMLARLSFTETTLAKNSQIEIYTSEKRLRTLERKLKTIESSKVKKYLQMQADEISAEKWRLQAAIAKINNEFSNNVYLVREDAIKEIELTISEIEKLIADHTIFAPISGQVARIFVKPGEYIDEKRAVVTLLPTGTEMIAELRISSQSISKIKKNQIVYLDVDAFPAYKYGYFVGTVTAVDGVKSTYMSQDDYIALVTINEYPKSRTPSSLSDVSNISIRLLPGMLVKARIVSHKASLISRGIDVVMGND